MKNIHAKPSLMQQDTCKLTSYKKLYLLNLIDLIFSNFVMGM